MPFWQVLALALLPAVGNFAGGVVAEMVRVTPRALNLALHAAAGILIAVVGVEIMPEALRDTPAWIVVMAFLLGGGTSVLIGNAVEALQRRKHGAGEGGSGAGPWMIYLAVAVDLFSDGLLVGAGSSIAFELAVVLALGQVTADLPEGFAVIAQFKSAGVARARRLALAASFAVPVLLGATVGYWLLRGQSENLKFAALAFVAGMLTLAAVEELTPEAHEVIPDGRLSAAALLGGFALFTLVSAYLG